MRMNSFYSDDYQMLRNINYYTDKQYPLKNGKRDRVNIYFNKKSKEFTNKSLLLRSFTTKISLQTKTYQSLMRSFARNSGHINTPAELLELESDKIASDIITYPSYPIPFDGKRSSLIPTFHPRSRWDYKSLDTIQTIEIGIVLLNLRGLYEILVKYMINNVDQAIFGEIIHPETGRNNINELYEKIIVDVDAKWTDQMNKELVICCIPKSNPSLSDPSFFETPKMVWNPHIMSIINHCFKDTLYNKASRNMFGFTMDEFEIICVNQLRCLSKTHLQAMIALNFPKFALKRINYLFRKIQQPEFNCDRVGCCDCIEINESPKEYKINIYLRDDEEQSDDDSDSEEESKCDKNEFDEIQEIKKDLNVNHQTNAMQQSLSLQFGYVHEAEPIFGSQTIPINVVLLIGMFLN